MAKRYVIATEEGTFPARPAHNTPAKIKALETCRKGWPDKKWKVFEIEYEGRALKVSQISDHQVRDTLLSELRAKFGHELRFV